MLSRGALHIAALGLLAACGPNYRYVYDGESAFERCYANDFDAAVAPAVRSRCWQEWLQSYSYDGAADRVEFARGRLTALESQAAAPLPAASGAPVAAGAPAPAPTPPGPALSQPSQAPDPSSASPQTPVAGVAEPWRAAPPSLPSTAPSPTQSPTQADPPGAACASACRTAWQLAAGRCSQRDAACVAQSDEGYRECMRGCF